MITQSQMYWITRLDNIQCFFAFAIVILIVVSLIIFIEGRINETDEWNMLSAISLTISLILLFISIWIPSTKDMAAIIVIPRVSKAIEANEKIKNMPDKLSALADEWIDSKMKEMKDGK